MPQTDQFTTKLNLPEPVANYVRAVNAGATNEFRASFVDDAVVVDVNRELSGLDSSRIGRAPTSSGLTCTSTSWTSQSARDEPLSNQSTALRSNGITRSSRDEP